jgi:hypothetical protein
MNKWKKFLIVFLGLGLISIATLSWYAYRYSMEPITGFEVNSDTLSTRVLIATQGSEFKEAVVSKVIETLKSKGIYFRIIDVSVLRTIDEEEWDAIVILHTWEYSRPPKSVAEFIARTNTNGKCMTVTTSGSGSKMPGVDAISSASKASEEDNVARAIVNWIESKTK